ncbi:MAG: tripeptide aminopeptidase PepT [Treponema sp.]|nr:tripeptide aminopeptidase PepT [Treponema sp.]
MKYVKIWSESDGIAADKGIFPSTERQFDFARILKEDLQELGVSKLELDENCYLHAFVPASKGMENKESILLMAHMDTVDEVTGKNVNPQIAKNPEAYTDASDTIVTTDGTTLLGADDKAGITAIMTALEFLQEHPEIKHSAFEIMFSPDEETGHGMDRVPLEKIHSKYALTVDGGDIGEMETECFNAFAAKVIFTGRAAHTGNARASKMVNAVSMAGDFVTHLPHTMTPETTDNFEGFIAPMSINGTIEEASVEMLLRSFSMEEIEKEKKIITTAAESVALSFGGKAEISFKQQYLNMKQKLDENPEITKKLELAFKAAGVEIKNTPIRGGTDGSRLTEMGIPTPNIFTGAHDFHSRNEWLSLNQCCKAADILINLLI